MGTKREKMPISERAKQFIPFSPLNGLQKALREKERSVGLIIRPELSDEMKDDIDKKLKYLDRCISESRITKAQISFFNNGRKNILKGPVEMIDRRSKRILIDHQDLKFEDILEINVLAEIE